MKGRIKKLEMEKGKRQLVEVMIMEASSEDTGGLGKKRIQVEDLQMADTEKMKPEVVLDDQHRLSQ